LAEASSGRRELFQLAVNKGNNAVQGIPVTAIYALQEVRDLHGLPAIIQHGFLNDPAADFGTDQFPGQSLQARIYTLIFPIRVVLEPSRQSFNRNKFQQDDWVITQRVCVKEHIRIGPQALKG
jgi:hypothetical protein